MCPQNLYYYSKPSYLRLLFLKVRFNRGLLQEEVVALSNISYRFFISKMPHQQNFLFILNLIYLKR